MMSRVHNGKEMETVNVHNEAVNFKENSTVLISTNKLHFVGTTTGGMIRVDGENMERSTFLNCRQSASITMVCFYNLQLYYIINKFYELVLLFRSVTTAPQIDSMLDLMMAKLCASILLETAAVTTNPLCLLYNLSMKMRVAF